MSKPKTTTLTLDGNEAAAYGSYALTEVAAIFPITPSSAMAEHIDAWSSKGKLNIFNSTVKVSEMQSEAGAAGAIHGALQGGALATTYTASQGLLLMIPNIYKCVGELLPAVFHVSARSLATRALSIFGDHQDIYAVRQTGITMLCSHSVQEVADLAPIAHLIAIKSSAPILHFFDGFRTSHEIQKVDLLDYSEISELLDTKALADFKLRGLNPLHPVTRGGAENDDIYFQGREAQNSHFGKVIDIVSTYLTKISKLTGRNYAPFVYYGPKDATKVIVAMGSVTQTIEEVVDKLSANGEKVGLVKVHLFRPFSPKHLLSVIPSTVTKIAVLDRTKEMGSVGEPLYLDVQGSIATSNRHFDVVVGGRYGLSSKDVQPNQIKAVYDHLDAKVPFNGFTIGIDDDVTKLSLKLDKSFAIDNYYTACLFYGLGSDGTVSANKNAIKIIGDHTDLYSQAYFAYDSKKAGGVTRSHLRFGKTPIKSTYYIKNADFVSCSQDSYLFKFDMLANLKVGGTFLLNTTIPASDIVKHLPNRVLVALAKKKAKFYIINATDIAKEIKMGRNTNTILQSAFFKLNPSIIPFEDALEYMKKAIVKSYSKKGPDVVDANYKAVEKGAVELVEIPISKDWAKLPTNTTDIKVDDAYFDEYVNQIAALNGYDLPVSTFTKYGLLDGSMRPNATSKEKRRIASDVPVWNKDKCIQCNKCVFVCPHATIRSFLLKPEEIVSPLSSDDVVTAKQVKEGDYSFRIQVSPQSCVGCGLCVVECPELNGGKALTMAPVTEKSEEENKKADYLYTSVPYRTELFNKETVKGVGFARPYFEMSGACAGCGETPYYRLVSQLFGQDMVIANATGCSSIYSGSTPSTPFVKDPEGKGPAWANSLFEDNAEFGYGIRLAINYKLAEVKRILTESLSEVEDDLATLAKQYIAVQHDKKEVKAIINELIAKIEASKSEKVKEVLKYKDYLVDKSVWIIGGDGWSYDIGFGGLDHVMANNENVNVLILDTEVYSNTGGQSSKSSQTGSIAKFTAGGKKTAKKDLGRLFVNYGHVYVAQVAMGANNNQLIKALVEAESYNGPSVVIAYSPCIEHGIKGGLKNHQSTQKKAVECGYFVPYRYDPRLIGTDKNPLQLDGPTPKFELFRDFVLSETRYSQLPIVNPTEAESLLTKSQNYAEFRYSNLSSQAKKE
jgi:pyruvate-ferredoxin/flavodoxin oxidoreductase